MNELDEDQPVDENPHIAFKTRWAFELGSRDSVLVLKCLGGREMTAEEDERARWLCDRLTAQRAAAGRDHLRALENAEEGMLRAHGQTVPVPERITTRGARKP